ncbi:MAG: type I 3-dehydroquinate dehydratase [Candidatus Caldarchaeum sp.]|nr:type I 3-dehydroquinate dehydratase [Candidatus Caldarchaeum sp.]MCS7138097.1 type I 3-dehydroquinate dehydratase [Candidatus Caldarchaeum sp.]MDW7978292.1 type I 3-dehydroquinate dehydratase [Candidatus Caldarchaeum sp.]MDW8359309.1 type I 3-dehydroquinate dehydratase [Candidatus Caldarchaeum sp.]
MRKTKVCVSVYGGDEYELGRKVETALSRGGDLVEARLDLSGVSSWDRVYTALKPFADRLILTLRPVDEWGKSELSDSERLAVLSKLCGMRPAYVDVELKTARSNSLEEIRRSGVKLIVSWHGAQTPETERLAETARECLQHGDIAKVVCLSNGAEDNFKVLMLYTQMPPEKLVAFCMGEKGWITRIVSMAAGAPIAYASLDEAATGPGQLPLNEMLEVRDRIVKGVRGC